MYPTDSTHDLVCVITEEWPVKQAGQTPGLGQTWSAPSVPCLHCNAGLHCSYLYCIYVLYAALNSGQNPSPHQQQPASLSQQAQQQHPVGMGHARLGVDSSSGAMQGTCSWKQWAVFCCDC